MQTINIVILALSAILISFHGYCGIFYMHDRNLSQFDPNRQLKYPSAYNFFSVLQWILIITNSIWIFGIIGLLIFPIIFICGSLLSTLYQKLTEMEANTALALFGISFWALFIATAIKIFFV